MGGSGLIAEHSTDPEETEVSNESTTNSTDPPTIILNEVKVRSSSLLSIRELRFANTQHTLAMHKQQQEVKALIQMRSPRTLSVQSSTAIPKPVRPVFADKSIKVQNEKEPSTTNRSIQQQFYLLQYNIELQENGLFAYRKGIPIYGPNTPESTVDGTVTEEVGKTSILTTSLTDNEQTEVENWFTDSDGDGVLDIEEVNSNGFINIYGSAGLSADFQSKLEQASNDPWGTDELVRAVSHRDELTGNIELEVLINEDSPLLDGTGWGDTSRAERIAFIKKLVTTLLSSSFVNLLCEDCMGEAADALKLAVDFLKEQRVPEDLWYSTPQLTPLNCGLAEGAAKSLLLGPLEIAQLLFMVSSSEEDASAFVEGISRLTDEGVLSGMVSQGLKKKHDQYLNADGSVKQDDQTQYKLGKDLGEVVGIAVETILTGGSGKVSREALELASRRVDNLLAGLGEEGLDAARRVLKKEGKPDADALKRLADDLEGNTNLADVLKAQPELVKAWKRLADLGRNQMRKDPSILASMRKTMDNPDIPSNRLDDIVNSLAESGARCKTCDNAGTEGLRYIDEVLDDLDGFAKEFKNTPGYDDFLREMGEQGKKATGSSWTLEALVRNRSKYFDGEVVDGFEIQHVPGKDFAADVITKVGNVTHYKEFKNWGSSQLGRSESSFVKQLTGTMSVIDDLGQMQFIFNPSRWTPTALQLKTALQSKASLLDELMSSGKLQQLMPDEVILSTSDFIDNLASSKYFDKVFIVQ